MESNFRQICIWDFEQKGAESDQMLSNPTIFCMVVACMHVIWRLHMFPMTHSWVQDDSFNKISTLHCYFAHSVITISRLHYGSVKKSHVFVRL